MLLSPTFIHKVIERAGERKGLHGFCFVFSVVFQKNEIEEEKKNETMDYTFVFLFLYALSFPFCVLIFS